MLPVRWLNRCCLASICLILTSAGALSAQETQPFQRGDANGDGAFDISDGINILNFLFIGIGSVDCRDAADVNDTGGLDLSDGVYVFNGLFTSGPLPPAPFGECGLDPTPDTLGCESYPLCEATDTEPPRILDVSLGSVGRTTARIDTLVDEPATMLVDYGLDTSYGQTATVDTNTGSARFDLVGLTAGTEYHYRVRAIDRAGNEAVSSDFVFQTLAAESDLTKIGHVLNRVTYGPTADEIDRVEAMGIEGFLEEQLDIASIDEDSNLALRSREEALFEERVIHDDTALVRSNEIWRYRKGTSEPPASWLSEGFDDSAWLSGPTGIGYGDDDDRTVLEDMRFEEDNPGTPGIDEGQPGYASFYVRKEFNVADVDAVESLIFRLDFDDAFVAYLNGTEVARQGISGTRPAFNQTATDLHEAGEAEDFDITNRKSLLHDGINTFAIQIHNANLDSSDSSCIPSLISRRTDNSTARTVIGGLTELQQLMHIRGIYARRQLQAVLGEFWENHFTTDYDKIVEYFAELQNSDGTVAMTESQARAEAAEAEHVEYEFFHDNALGNFGDLLLYSATSPTMLVYLDNVLNIRGNANENYAREILELGAFGVDNRYEQSDIEELARCFTGWNICKVLPEDRPEFPASATDPPTECGVLFEDTTIIGLGAGWRYFKGTQEPSPGAGGVPTLAWAEPDFNDAGWLSGSTGIGYGDGDDTTVLSDMRNNYTSVYLRREFTVVDPLTSLENLVLSLDYDDGAIVYLNGIEVARTDSMEDAGSPPAFDDTSDEGHEVTEGTDVFNLQAYVGFLRPAPQVNVLAIQLHNTNITSSDASCLPRLADRATLPGSVENGDPGAVWTFRFNPEDHDTEAKQLFPGTPFQIDIPAGRTGAAGLRDALDVIDEIVAHPSTAEFICIKLIQKFVSDEITLTSFQERTAPIELRELLADMIAAWNSTSPRGNIETVMRTLLDSSDQTGVFWQDIAYRGKVKTSIEWINANLRLLEADASGDELPELNDQMGMTLFQRDDPDGYSELGGEWMDTATMLARIRFVRELAANDDSDFSFDLTGYLNRHQVSTAEEIVEFFSRNLFHGTLSPASRSLLLEFLTTDDNGNPRSLNPGAADYRRRVEDFIGLVLSMPHAHFQ